MKVTAILSCPRLGFTDFQASSLMAFSNAGVSLQYSFGVYWDIAMGEGMRTLVEDNDYIMTTDYDSLFDAENVRYLIKLMEENKDVGAICSLQQARGQRFLFTPEGEKLTIEEMQQDLLPIKTGHFGLSIFRSEALQKTPKPWFQHKYSSEGTMEKTSDKIDADVNFWLKFKEAGNSLYLAPRNVIGHLELMVNWPSKDLQSCYQTVFKYREHGKPDAVFK